MSEEFRLGVSVGLLAALITLVVTGVVISVVAEVRYRRWLRYMEQEYPDSD